MGEVPHLHRLHLMITVRIIQDPSQRILRPVPLGGKLIDIGM